MWTTMKNNFLRGKKEFWSCSFYLYRFCKYVSYGFPIINCCNLGVHYETPCISKGLKQDSSSVDIHHIWQQENSSEVFRQVTKLHLLNKWPATLSSNVEHHSYSPDNDNIYTLSSQIFYWQITCNITSSNMFRLYVISRLMQMYKELNILKMYKL